MHTHGGWFYLNYSWKNMKLKFYCVDLSRSNPPYQQKDKSQLDQNNCSLFQLCCHCGTEHNASIGHSWVTFFLNAYKSKFFTIMDIAYCMDIIQHKVHIIYFNNELILQVAYLGNLLSCYWQLGVLQFLPLPLPLPLSLLWPLYLLLFFLRTEPQCSCFDRGCSPAGEISQLAERKSAGFQEY